MTVLLLTLSAFCGHAAAQSADAFRRSVYSYDAELPLEPTSRPIPDKSAAFAGLRRRFRVEFASVHDQRVPAILSLPVKAKPPYPAVILLAGSGGHKDSDYIRIAADMFSTMGCATLSIDAQYHGDRSRKGRSGDIHFIQKVVNRDAWVQTVVDLRRAVDYLQSRTEVDRSRIGFFGFSQGGMIGATFIGIEPRVKCAVLAVAGGGFVEWGKTLQLYTDADLPRFRLFAAMVEPLDFIDGFAGRPLLMLNAKRDELIPRSAAEALFGAAAEPKRQVWFDGGHVLPPTAMITEVKPFFAKNL
jgi:dienelactone hydrolase